MSYFNVSCVLYVLCVCAYLLTANAQSNGEKKDENVPPPKKQTGLPDIAKLTSVQAAFSGVTLPSASRIFLSGKWEGYLTIKGVEYAMSFDLKFAAAVVSGTGHNAIGPFTVEEGVYDDSKRALSFLCKYKLTQMRVVAQGAVFEQGWNLVGSWNVTNTSSIMASESLAGRWYMWPLRDKASLGVPCDRGCVCDPLSVDDPFCLKFRCTPFLDSFCKVKCGINGKFQEVDFRNVGICNIQCLAGQPSAINCEVYGSRSVPPVDPKSVNPAYKLKEGYVYQTDNPASCCVRSDRLGRAIDPFNWQSLTPWPTWRRVWLVLGYDFMSVYDNAELREMKADRSLESFKLVKMVYPAKAHQRSKRLNFTCTGFSVYLPEGEQRHFCASDITVRNGWVDAINTHLPQMNT